MDEFLSYVPRRGDYPWETTPDGLVQVTVPKFTSNVGLSFAKLLRKENLFTAHFDHLGSEVWKLCDGAHTVQQILTQLKSEFPKEENLDQRLILFLQQMGSLNYLTY